MSTRSERTLTFTIIGLFVMAVMLMLMLPSCKHEPLLPPEQIFTSEGGTGGTAEPIDTNVYCDPDTVYFQQTILPMLVTYCATPGCHDAISHEEGVRLYDYQHIMQQVHPYDPGHSDLYDEVQDGDMPPNNSPQLSNAQQQLLYDWIMQGAQNNSCESTCNLDNVTWSGTILPLFELKCNGCHGGSNPQGSLSLNSWSVANTVAMDGRLAGAVQHVVDFSAMPPSGGMLPQCDIDKILIWVQAGAPNN
ncbi:MAG: hypothetical protein H6594_04300 [Flavobacteriales bacterium]|nr:hypothetical protein [Flavobacteriales bacterium]